MAGNSQKFIARNRAPRVQIEYDVELYGAEKKVQLPFVMGVLSDLSGKSLAEPPAVADRRFLEIDADNFDDRMKAMAPRAAFSVPNTLTGEGQLSVDLTFERMADFTPAAVARKVAPLRALLEARERLAHLATYMDGKVGAEALIERLLADPAALASLAATLPEAAEGETAEALATLRDAMPEDAPEDDGTATLDVLRAAAPAEVEEADTAGDVLAGIARAEETAEVDRTGDVLAGIERAEEMVEEDGAADVLAGIARAEDAPEVDDRDDVLSRIERREEASASDEAGDVLGRMERAPDEVPETDGAEDVLAGIARAKDVPEDDDRDDVLSRMERREEAPASDEAGDVLGRMERRAEAPVSDDAGDVLGRMERATDAVPEREGAGDVLAGIERAEEAEEADERGDVLAGLESREAAAEADEASAVLEGLERVPDVPAAGAEAEGILAGVERAGEAAETDDRGDVLAGMQRVEEDDRADDSAATLAGLAEESSEDGDDLAGLGGEDGAAGAEEDDDLATLMAELEADDASAGGEDDETGADALIEGLDTAAESDEEEEDPETAALMAELADEDDNEAEDPELAALMAGLDDDAGEGDDDAALSTAEEEGEAAGLLAGDTAEAEDDSEEDAELAALMAGLDEDDEDDEEDPELAALMAGLEEEEGKDGGEAGRLLAGDTEAEGDSDEEDTELAALMAGLDDDDDSEGEEDPDLAALMAGLDDDDGEEGEDPDLAALMAGLDDESEAGEDGDAELSALMAGLDGDGDSGEDDELEKLMAGLDDDEGGAGDDELDSLMAGLDDDEAGAGDGELDALMAGLDGDGSGDAEGSGAEAQDLTLSDEAEHAFGTMGAARPEPAKLERQRFRIALFGDFSGRSARGILETGEALAAREGVVLDCDSVEEIIEGFATTLVLPLGKDGQGMEVSLKELDDLHPDELYENLPIFAELKGLRQQLGSAATAQGAAEKLRRWGEEHGVAVRPPQRHSAANTVRADLRLSDFEKLIGASAPAPRATASSVEDLLARVVGPHVRKAQGADAAAMQTAVDEALSAAMRMVLHHPDFQAIEAQWRTLDLIARSIETDDSLEVMLYDLSAEEIAADIAAHDDLSQSGLARLLTEKPLDEENGRGAFSVLIGLYTFEETPPHAELLGRIARIAAHVDAPFVTAITPDFIDTKMEDRHRLVAEAWDTLRAMPEARHLGLVSPRFLLRRPYGEKSEPIYEFDFEEFTMAEGLSGMLWANPAVLPAILMAQSFRKNGMGLQLGSVMSLGGMPYHFVTDRHGDQVALPCTERNFSVDKHTAAVRRGYMPVLSVKGRDEVRLGSFNAVAGEELLGPWSKVPPPPPSPPKPPRPAPAPAAEAEDDDDLAGFGGDSDDDDLDALLAGFNDSSDDDDDGDGDLDAELAALLNDL